MKLDYQGKQLKLHKRATCLLELLKKAQSEQWRQEKLLSEWRSAGNFDNVRLFTHENNYLIRIAELNDIQKRIHIVTGISADVEIVKPGELPRTEGKAKRVLDLRKGKM